MKKRTLFIQLIFIFAFLVLNSGCKKKDNPVQGDGKDYRVTSSAFFNAQDDVIENHVFEYDQDKLIRHKKYMGYLYQEVTDYTYYNDLVIAETEGYKQESLHKKDSIEYHFDGNLLTEIKNWTKKDSVWTEGAMVSFSYTGGLVSEYSETLEGEPMYRAFYTYSGELLDEYNCEVHFEYQDQWAKRFIKRFTYEGSTLVQQNSGIGEDEKNYYYHYDDGRLSRTDVHQIEMVDFYYAYYMKYTYDQNGAMIQEEKIEPTYDEMFYRIEYQYEEGESNLGHIIYSGYELPGMMYPKP